MSKSKNFFSCLLSRTVLVTAIALYTGTFYINSINNLAQASSVEGDFNGDGYVNLKDFEIFKFYFGVGYTDDSSHLIADMNGDGMIGAPDFGLWAQILRQYLYCGDGVISHPNSEGINEQCDDYNIENGDGCSEDCQAETIYRYVNEGETIAFYAYDYLNNPIIFPHGALIEDALLGDTNLDGAVDFIDFQPMGAMINKTAGDPEFDPLYDFNSDGRISTSDIYAIINNFNLGGDVPGALHRNYMQWTPDSADQGDHPVGQIMLHVNNVPVCGDGTCDALSEDILNCPQDCSNAIDVQASASRTNGVAPLAVSFNALGTTHYDASIRPRFDLNYIWDFNDPTAGTWQHSRKNKNKATGFVAGHVFETPGQYNVTLTVNDEFGNASSETIPITVEDPNVVFSGQNTVCIRANSFGDFNGCPAGALQITNNDFDSVFNGHAGAGKRILFRRGDTFISSQRVGVSSGGPGILGAFGTGPKPYIPTSDGFITFGGKSGEIKDWRVMDLRIEGPPGIDDIEGIAETAEDTALTKQLTFLRNDISGYFNGIAITIFHGNEVAVPSEIAVVENHIHDNFGLTSSGSLKGNMNLGLHIKNSMVLGNDFGDAGEHTMRCYLCQESVIQHNLFDNYVGDYGAHIKLHAPGQSLTGNKAWLSGKKSENFIVSDNMFLTGGNGDGTFAGASWPVAFAPQNGSSDERIENFIFERNYLGGGSGISSVMLYIVAQKGMIRNNVFDHTGGFGSTGISLNSQSGLPTPSSNRIDIVNNVCYDGDSVSTFDCVAITSSAHNITVKNNLFYSPNGGSLTTGSAPDFESNNYYASSNPFLNVTGTMKDPLDFQLDLTKSEVNNFIVDQGASISLMEDCAHKPRPQGQGWDIGAYEIQAGAGPFCGDGLCNGLEVCDACTADCGVCPPVAQCGNGIAEAGEGCDDGNTVNGDGCSSHCALEYCGDVVCNNGEDCSSCSTDCGSCPVTPVCGNGTIEQGEECDDGNNEDNDGCSSGCHIEQSTESYTAFYSLDGSAHDLSGNGHHGTIVGATFANGVSGQALRFNGTSDYVDLGNFDIGGDALAITAWIKPEGFDNEDDRIISKATGSAEQSHYFMISTSESNGKKLRFRLKTNGSTSTLIAASGNLETGVWTHIAAVYDGNQMIIYKDGIPVGNASKTGPLTTDPSVNVRLGQNPVDGGTFDGLIDDVRILNRALSGSEIQILMDSGVVPPPPDPVCGNGIKEPGEVCDGNDFGSQTCVTQGFDAGTLTCAGTCSAINTGACINLPDPVCGNGIIESGEQCEGGNLNGQSCTSQGFTSGVLSCHSSTCQFDRSNCQGSTSGGAEARCLELGGDCLCSEPMNSNEYPNGGVPYNWNPSDTPSSSNKECTDVTGVFFDHNWAPSLISTVPAAAMPSGNTVSNVIRVKDSKGSGGLLSLIGSWTADPHVKRACIRYYKRVSDNWHTEGATSCPVYTTKNFTFEDAGNQVFQLAPGCGSDQCCGPGNYGNYVYFMNANGETGDSGSFPVTPDDCKSNWCRFESCISGDISQGKNILVDTSITVVKDQNPQRYEAKRLGNNGSPINYNNGISGLAGNFTHSLGDSFQGESWQEISHFMHAEFTTDSGKWIGPAMEVEGCTNDTGAVCAGGGGNSDPVCGNGIAESGEGCDDGNTNDGDGCSSTCTVESTAMGCDCQDIDGDGYPDNGSVCTGTFAERESPWNPDPDTLDLTIRYTWDQERACGMFANGDYWVQVDQGDNLELVSITPDKQTVGGRMINGYQKNIFRQISGGTEDLAPKQSLDSIRPWYQPPLAVEDLDPRPGTGDYGAGDVVIKMISRIGSGQLHDGGSGPCPGGGAPNCLYYSMPLTIVSQIIPDSNLKFRPPYAGRVDMVEGVSLTFHEDAADQIRPIYDATDIDFENFYPRLSCPSCEPHINGTYSVERMRDRYAVPHATGMREDNQHANFKPVIAFGVLGDNAYGGDYSRDEAKYAILMTLDRFDPDPVLRNVAYHAAINQIQSGIDFIHFVRDGDYNFSGGGGHAGGMSLSMWHAAAALRHPDLMAFMADPYYRHAQGAARTNIERGAGTPLDDDSAFMSTVVDQGYFDHVRNWVTGEIDGNAYLQNGPVTYGQACGSKRKGPTSCSGSGKGGCTRCDVFCDAGVRSDVLNGDGAWTQCSDPADLIDGGGHAGSGTTDYEKEHLCSLTILPIAVRQFAGGDEAWAMPESYQYAMRRWKFGIWTQPDGFSGAGSHHGTHAGEAGNGQFCNEISKTSAPGQLMEAYREEFWNKGPYLIDGSPE